MKRKFSIALGLIAAAAAIPVFTSTPVFAELAQAGETLVQNILQPKVKLVLGVQQKTTTTDAEGNEVVSWKKLEGEAQVQPGDILRYSLNSENSGDKPAKNLVLTQPIPAQTAYVLDSARANGATLTYSIDGGQTYTVKPTIEVTLPDGTVEQQPAPAESYTHVRWDYSESLAPLSSVRAVYEVAVK